MIEIKAKCEFCSKIAMFRTLDTIELDTTKEVLLKSDQTSLRLPCPHCAKQNDFFVIVEVDEAYEYEIDEE